MKEIKICKHRERKDIWLHLFGGIMFQEVPLATVHEKNSKFSNEMAENEASLNDSHQSRVSESQDMENVLYETLINK